MLLLTSVINDCYINCNVSGVIHVVLAQVGPIIVVDDVAVHILAIMVNNADQPLISARLSVGSILVTGVDNETRVFACILLEVDTRALNA